MSVKYNTIQELAQILESVIEPYHTLLLDTYAMEEEQVFIHYKDFTSGFGIDLKDMTLMILKDGHDLVILPFTFQTLLEKLNEYYAQ